VESSDPMSSRPKRRPPSSRTPAPAPPKRTWWLWAVGAVVLLLAVLVVVIIAGSTSSSSAGVPAGTRTFAETDHTHTTDPVHYDHTPPAGGAHNPLPQNCGVYDQPIPDEHAVHSLEHGTVWITYLPSLPAADVARLQSFVTSHYDGPNRYLLLSPYPGQHAPVVATAWGAQLSLQSVSDPRLLAFVQHYIGGNQGGEKGAYCVGVYGTPQA
jgi:Protein of unknown function (DUF3105)